MGALSAFQKSYLEEIMLTDLILSNLANVSGYPFKKIKKEEGKIHTKIFPHSLCVEIHGSFKSRFGLLNAFLFLCKILQSSTFHII